MRVEGGGWRSRVEMELCGHPSEIRNGKSKNILFMLGNKDATSFCKNLQRVEKELLGLTAVWMAALLGYSIDNTAKVPLAVLSMVIASWMAINSTVMDNHGVSTLSCTIFR